jgi:hypothetical protein
MRMQLHCEKASQPWECSAQLRLTPLLNSITVRNHSSVCVCTPSPGNALVTRELPMLMPRSGVYGTADIVQRDVKKGEASTN